MGMTFGSCCQRLTQRNWRGKVGWLRRLVETREEMVEHRRGCRYGYVTWFRKVGRTLASLPANLTIFDAKNVVHIITRDAYIKCYQQPLAGQMYFVEYIVIINRKGGK